MVKLPHLLVAALLLTLGVWIDPFPKRTGHQVTPQQDVLAPPLWKAPSLDVCPQREPGPHRPITAQPGPQGCAGLGTQEPARTSQKLPCRPQEPSLLLQGHSCRNSVPPQGVLIYEGPQSLKGHHCITSGPSPVAPGHRATPDTWKKRSLLLMKIALMPCV